MSVSLTVLVIYCLAVARMTRLINADTILDRPRLVLASAAKAAHTAGDAAGEARWNTALYFVQCPWCVGFWVSLATAWIPTWHSHNPVAVVAGIALAASHLVGVFSFAANTEDVDYEDETTD